MCELTRWMGKGPLGPGPRATIIWSHWKIMNSFKGNGTHEMTICVYVFKLHDYDNLSYKRINYIACK